MKYYSNPQGRAFGQMYEHREWGKRLIGFDGKTTYNVFANGKIEPISYDGVYQFNCWINSRDIIPASDELLKEFGLTKTGFYIAKSRKPFSVKANHEEFSRYVWELKENGDWEPAMIEGPDYDVYYKAGSARAIRFDKKVDEIGRAHV